MKAKEWARRFREDAATLRAMFAADGRPLVGFHLFVVKAAEAEAAILEELIAEYERTHGAN